MLVLDRADVVLEILSHLGAQDLAIAAGVCTAFAAAARDVRLWKAHIPSWWAPALAVELPADDLRGWRHNALALHEGFPEALDEAPLELLSDSESESESDSDDDGESAARTRTAKLTQSIYKLASRHASAIWPDLILTKALHELEQEQEEEQIGAMLRYCLARAVWRRGHWRRALRGFRAAVEIDGGNQNEAELRAGLGVFLLCCPVPGGDSTTPLAPPRLLSAAVPPPEQRSLDVETACAELRTAVGQDESLGWVFSEVGEERLSKVMAEMEGDHGFNPPPTPLTELDWRGPKPAGSPGQPRKLWAPADCEDPDRPPWERKTIRTFNTGFQRHCAERHRKSHEGPLAGAEAAAAAAAGGLPGAPGSTTGGEDWLPHVGCEQYDSCEAFILAAAVFEAASSRLPRRAGAPVGAAVAAATAAGGPAAREAAAAAAGTASALGDLSVALRCANDNSWALSVALAAIPMLRADRLPQPDQPPNAGDDDEGDEDDDEDDDEGEGAQPQPNPQGGGAAAAADDSDQSDDDEVVGDGSTAESAALLSLHFACAVQYSERAAHAHAALLLRCADYPPAAETEKVRLRAELARFDAEACGTTPTAAGAGAAAAAGAGTASSNGGESDVDGWQEQLLQAPEAGSTARLWQERRTTAVREMNAHFEGALLAMSSSGSDRQRTVAAEWVHSLSEAGEPAQCSDRLQKLQELLRAPVDRARAEVQTAMESGKEVRASCLDVLEEEMACLMLRGRIEENSPWSIEDIVSPAPKPLPPSCLSADGVFRDALSRARLIAENGPAVLSLARPLPEGICWCCNRTIHVNVTRGTGSASKRFEGCRKCQPIYEATKIPIDSAAGPQQRWIPTEALPYAFRRGAAFQLRTFPTRLNSQTRVLREMGRAALSRYDLEAARQRMKECVALVEPAWKTMAFDTTECAEAWELQYYKVPLAARSIAGAGSSITVASGDSMDRAVNRRKKLLRLCGSTMAEAKMLLAQLAQRTCEHEECEEACVDAIELAMRLPARQQQWIMMLATGIRGDAALTRGEWGTAASCYSSALVSARDLGETLAAAAAELQLAEVERRRGLPQEVAQSRRRAAAAGSASVLTAVGALRTVAAALRTSASGAIAAGAFETARRQLRACYTLVLRETPPWFSGQSSVLHVLATLCTSTSQKDAAAKHLRAGLALARRATDPMLIAIHVRDLCQIEGAISGAERSALVAEGAECAAKVRDEQLISCFSDGGQAKGAGRAKPRTDDSGKMCDGLVQLQ